MAETNVKVCRLCLFATEICDVITSVQQAIIQIIVPELDIHQICNELYICRNCTSSLEETFSFKSSVLDIEDTVINYTNDEVGQINLQKLMGLNDLVLHGKIESNTQICRTCLNIAEPLSYIKLDKNDSPTEWEMLQYSFSEVDLNLAKDPVICKKCLQMLKKLYEFHKKCNESDNRISTYLRNKSDIFKASFKLGDIFKSPIDKQSDTINILNDDIQIKNVGNVNELDKENLKSINSEDAILKNHRDSRLKIPIPNDDMRANIEKATEELDSREISDLASTTLVAQEDGKRAENSKNSNDSALEISSEETNSNPENINKPYNKGNKRKQNIVEVDEENPVYTIDIDEELDEGYGEGSENICRAPKKRPCEHCRKPIAAAFILHHKSFCMKNPKNKFMVDCAHCGTRTTSMQKLLEHRVGCMAYQKWKIKSVILEELRNTSTKRLNQNNSSIVVDVDSEGESQMADPESTSQTAEITSNSESVAVTVDVNSAQKHPNEINVTQNCSSTEDSATFSFVFNDFSANTISQMDITGKVSEDNVAEESSTAAKEILAPSSSVLNSSETNNDDWKMNSCTSESEKGITSPSLQESAPTNIEDIELAISSITYLPVASASADSDRTSNKKPTRRGNTYKSYKKASPCNGAKLTNSQKIPPLIDLVDSSSSAGPTIAIRSSAITTTDYLKAELKQIASSFHSVVGERFDVFVQQARAQYVCVLKCDTCYFNTRHLHAIETHVLTHIGKPDSDGRYKCRVCFKFKSELNDFISHMEVQHKRSFYNLNYWCVRCSRGFDDIHDIRHIIKHSCKHYAGIRKTFTINGVVFCMQCNFESEKLLEVNAHIPTCEHKRDEVDPTAAIIEIDDD